LYAIAAMVKAKCIAVEAFSSVRSQVNHILHSKYDLSIINNICLSRLSIKKIEYAIFTQLYFDFNTLVYSLNNEKNAYRKYSVDKFIKARFLAAVVTKEWGLNVRGQSNPHRMRFWTCAWMLAAVGATFAAPVMALEHEQ
jgi:hypothetical protein